MMATYALAFVLAATPVQEPYRLPPPEVVAIADAAPAPSVRFSPGQGVDDPRGAGCDAVARGPLATDAAAGGDANRSRANAYYQTSFENTLALWNRETMEHEHVPMPDGARISGVSWAHDSKHFAFTLAFEDHSELWVASVEDVSSPTRLSTRLNMVLDGYSWTPDARGLLFIEVPEDRGEPPAEPRVPGGPNIQETSGETSPLRTYQDLLTNEHDAQLFEYYARGVPVLATVDGNRSVMGQSDLYASLSASPNSRHLLVERIQRPFSYLMPYWLFPRQIEVWNEAGAHLVVDVPLGDGIPIGGVRTGPRSVRWQAGELATLLWVEALDGGDPDAEVEHRDRWMSHAAPFRAEPKELFRLEHRSRGLTFLKDTTKIIASEYDRDRCWTRTQLFDVARPWFAPAVLEDRSVRDRYADPGRIVMTYDRKGSYVALQQGDVIFRTGSGASPEGLLPFLDSQNLTSLATNRHWRCEPVAYESVAAILDDGGEVTGFVTRRETTTTPTNYWLHTRPEEGAEAPEPVALTSFEDPTPRSAASPRSWSSTNGRTASRCPRPSTCPPTTRRGSGFRSWSGLSDRVQRPLDRRADRLEPRGASRASTDRRTCTC